MSDIAPRPDHLLVIDSRVTGWPSHLIAAGPDAAVLILDAGKDRLAQIAEVAADYAPLAGLTLLGHGSPGLLLLGQTVLDGTALDNASHILGCLAASLALEARIHLLGLPGAGVAGRYLAHRLAQATGRSVITDQMMKRPVLVPAIGLPMPVAAVTAAAPEQGAHMAAGT
ncbi:DUF4347 domain-containing protein [Teichococcus oryzae]|nr:DUF4347 domain-containing protein [Pseudoroseomonas oryzae]